jgi:hypothetical protein
MNKIEELVIEKMKNLSINQQQSVLYFIDKLLAPEIFKSDDDLEKLLIEGVDSLERGEAIEVTDEWWNQERERLVKSSQSLSSTSN